MKDFFLIVAAYIAEILLLSLSAIMARLAISIWSGNTAAGMPEIEGAVAMAIALILAKIALV